MKTSTIRSTPDVCSVVAGLAAGTGRRGWFARAGRHTERQHRLGLVQPYQKVSENPSPG